VSSEVDRVYGCRLTISVLREQGLDSTGRVAEFEQNLDRSGLDMVSQYAERVANASADD
jgi:hypothetical protein